MDPKRYHRAHRSQGCSVPHQLVEVREFKLEAGRITKQNKKLWEAQAKCSLGNSLTFLPLPLSAKNRTIMNETQKQKQKGNLKKWGCQYLPQYAHLVPVLLVRGDSSHSVLVCLCFCVFCVCVQYSSCSAVGLTTPHVTRYGSIPPSLPLPGFFFLSLSFSLFLCFHLPNRFGTNPDR